MSNIKFSQLPNLTTPAANAIIPAVNAGINYTITAANLQSYINNSTGNITGGNLISTGAIVATGNITGAYILGNGSQLTGLPASYGNANVAAYLPTYTGNLSPGNLSVSGNATVGNITVASGRVIDAGSNKIINLGAPVANSDAVTKSYVDSQVAGDLFAVQDDTATTIGVAKSSTLLFSGVAGETTVEVSAPETVTIGLPDDVSIVGDLGAGGNITAGYFIGDGSQLSNIIANVALQGNLQGNLAGNGFGANNFTFLSATGNITGANITASGNVQGTYVKGNGSALTGIVNSIVAGTGISVSAATGTVTITNNNPTPYANANVVSLMAAFGSNTIVTTGNITSGNLTATGNVQGSYLKGNASQATGIPTSIAAGTGISVNAATGAITVTNSGVTGLTAGSGITLSGSTGNVTITATGGGGGGSSIANGTSNVSIPVASGNVNITVSGNANVGQFTNQVPGTSSQGLIVNGRLRVTDPCALGATAGSGYTTVGGDGLDVAYKVIAGTGFQSGLYTPSSSSGTGVQGTIRWDANYIYICTATNTWKRVALSAF